MSNSFIANVNTLAANINTITNLATTLNEENVSILQQLLGEIDLIPIIEDLEKGTFNGNRQIKINLLKNYLGYNTELNEEELEDLYLDVVNRPEYDSLTLYFNDKTSVEIPFIQDGVPYSISTNVELYEFLVDNPTITDRLNNTLFFMIPAPVVSTELVIADVNNQLSNLLQISLHAVDNDKYLEQVPTYDWVEYTSSLQLLSQYFSAIQFLAVNIEDVLGIPDEAQAIYDEIKALSVDLETTIQTILVKVADPTTANVGDVLTVTTDEKGQKVAKYEAIKTDEGYKIPPATVSILGGIKGGGVGTGFSISADGTMSLNKEEITSDVQIPEIPQATNSVAGIAKLSSSLTSSATDTAVSSIAGKQLNDKLIEVENTTNSHSQSIITLETDLKAQASSIVQALADITQVESDVADKLGITGGTVTGDLTLNGNLTLLGDFINQGSESGLVVKTFTTSQDFEAPVTGSYIVVAVGGGGGGGGGGVEQLYGGAGGTGGNSGIAGAGASQTPNSIGGNGGNGGTYIGYFQSMKGSILKIIIGAGGNGGLNGWSTGTFWGGVGGSGGNTYITDVITNENDLSKFIRTTTYAGAGAGGAGSGIGGKGGNGILHLIYMGE